MAENSSVDVRSVELPQHRAAEILHLGAAVLLSLRQQPSTVQAQAQAQARADEGLGAYLLESQEKP